MSDKYGYFEYSDFALGAREAASFSVNVELQEGSDIQSLKRDFQPVEFVSLEQDSYITSNPKPFYFLDVNGIATAQTSDQGGAFQEPVVITISFPSYFSMTGLTVKSKNIITSARIQAFRDGSEITSGVFSATEKNNFYNIPMEFVNEIVFTVSSIDKPYNFLDIYGILFGRARVFNEENTIRAEVSNYFSVLGESLQYDTLDLSIINPVDDSYLFQRKQPIDYIYEGSSKSRFYVDSGEEENESAVSLTAYDEIANLEDTFLGGLYSTYPLVDLLSDIFSGTGVAYETAGISDVVVTGYLPVSSRRKALQAVLQGTNTRCYKTEKLVFKPLESDVMQLVFDESNIVEKPKKTKKQEIRSVRVKQHNYSMGAEEAELFHWYLSTTESTTITFPSPMHSIAAYEVIGEDENGQDIISETESENVSFVSQGVNYVTVENSSQNKIVIRGKKYIDSVTNHERLNPLISANELYSEIVVDLTIYSNARNVCDLLFDLHSRKSSVLFKTIDLPEIGCLYNVLGEDLNISSITNTLTGIYEVEAM